MGVVELQVQRASGCRQLHQNLDTKNMNGMCSPPLQVWVSVDSTYLISREGPCHFSIIPTHFSFFLLKLHRIRPPFLSLSLLLKYLSNVVYFSGWLKSDHMHACTYVLSSSNHKIALSPFEVQCLRD